MRANVGAKIALMLAATSAAAAGPSTKPAVPTRSELAHWLAMLGDPESTTREQARVALMGLSPGDLPALRDLVQSQRPLRPGQSEPLRDIVVYVRVRAELLKLPSESNGMLGVTWVPRDQASGADDATALVPGVAIDHCLPGLVGYRYLQPGDLIIASGDDDPMPPVTNLRDVVGERAGGTPIRFLVRRAGVLVKVRLTLDRRPSELNPTSGPTALDDLVDTAKKEAQAYFEREFSPLLSEAGA